MATRLSHEDLEHVLKHTRNLWEELRGQRIFVTGGTGFLGCWLLETFAFANDQLNLGAQLVTLTRDSEAFRRKAPHLVGHSAIDLWKGDVRDFEFPLGKFSHVIHAGSTSGSPVKPLEMFETVIAGTRRTLDFAVASGARKFLLASSGAVYGKQPSEMLRIPETYAGAPDLTSPNSDYGEWKRAAERLCALFFKTYGVETKIARCFAFVGPYLPIDTHYAIGNFIRDALAGRPICVRGDGTQIRSYLYAADLVAWLWTILLQGEPLHPYNVGSEEAISIADLAKKVGSIAGLGAEILIAQQPDPLAAPMRYVPDCSNARELGLQSWIPIDEQIRRTLVWHAQ